MAEALVRHIGNDCLAYDEVLVCANFYFDLFFLKKCDGRKKKRITKRVYAFLLRLFLSLVLVAAYAYRRFFKFLGRAYEKIIGYFFIKI